MSRTLAEAIGGKSPGVAILAVALFASSIMFFSYFNTKTHKAATVWAEYAATAAQQKDKLTAIQSEIGYGGFIHNVKNFALRQGDDYADMARADAARIDALLNELDHMMPQADAKSEIEVIRSMVASYRAMLDEATASPTEAARDIARIVVVDDAAAFQAFENLDNMVAADVTRLRALNHKNYDRLVSFGRFGIGYGVMIFLVGAGIVYLLFRGVETNAKLERSIHETSMLWEQAPDATLSVDPDGVIQRCNDQASALLEYSSEELTGMKVEQLVPEDVRARHEGHRRSFHHNPRRRPMGEDMALEALTKSGVRVPVAISLGTFRAGGQHTTIVTLRDISHQIAMESKLIAERTKADAANAAKSAFLATMSHEIRTPMTAVLGFSDILLKTELSRDAREMVGKIKDSTRSLIAIINDILDLSKLESGYLETESIDYALHALVHETADMFKERRRTSREKELELVVNLSADFPATAHGDPLRLRQILVNLIGNGIKFTLEGRVSVDATLENAASGTPMIRIAIADTGVGIKPEDTERLFSEFEQADTSVSRRYGGTGLGLTICKRLVEMQGGEIGVTSTPGDGSTFWFTLPYVPADDAAQVEAPSYEASSEVQVASRELDILVAEDSNLNQEIIKALIEGLGHKVTFANNGMEAVKLHRQGDYSLILMDVRMPEMSGIEATREIRKLPGPKGDIPIVALTADVIAENVDNCMEAGMNGVACKPIDMQLLTAAMDDALGQPVHGSRPAA